MRAAITGIGVITPAGIGMEEFQSALERGKRVTGKVTRFDPSAYPTDQAGELPNDFDSFLPRSLQLPSGQGLSTRFVVSSTYLALKDAGYLDSHHKKASLIVGTVAGNRGLVERNVRGGILNDRPTHGSLVRPTAELFSISGPSFVISNACATSNTAIARSMDLLHSGVVDYAIVCGVDEVTEAMYAMFSQHNALSDAIRPFDANRDGIVLSEGGIAFILESEGRAKKEGKRIYGVVSGYGASSDAHDMTHPHPNGAGARRSMIQAMKNAGLTSRDIGLVSAHGTGTIANDFIEANAIESLFKDNSEYVVTAVKSVFGHMQGAAGALGLLSCIACLNREMVYPIANLRDVDSGINIPLATELLRLERGKPAAISNAFGFGGSVSSVVVQR